MKIFVAITGASGTIYAQQLIEALKASSLVDSVAVTFTEKASEVATIENISIPLEGCLVYGNDDFSAPPASGSSAPDAMVVVPCSMGMLSKIAVGAASDLVSRAADVMMKERLPLILVTRETPLNIIHLDNMKRATQAGAIILPASPSFYNSPQTIEDLCRTVTSRILAVLGVCSRREEWDIGL